MWEAATSISHAGWWDICIAWTETASSGVCMDSVTNGDPSILVNNVLSTTTGVIECCGFKTGWHRYARLRQLGGVCTLILTAVCREGQSSVHFLTRSASGIWDEQDATIILDVCAHRVELNYAHSLYDQGCGHHMTIWEIDLHWFEMFQMLFVGKIEILCRHPDCGSTPTHLQLVPTFETQVLTKVFALHCAAAVCVHEIQLCCGVVIAQHGFGLNGGEQFIRVLYVWVYFALMCFVYMLALQTAVWGSDVQINDE